MVYIIKKEDIGKDFGVFTCSCCDMRQLVDLKAELGIVLRHDIGREVHKINDKWIVESEVSFKERRELMI